MMRLGVLPWADSRPFCSVLSLCEHVFAHVPMPSSHVVRDPVHGMIELTVAEWAAVDTPVFQRLRRVRQLAMTYLVYPGALHTRFEHSIGVRHIAGRLGR